MTTINSNNGDGQTSPTYDNYGQKPEDDKKLFVGKIFFVLLEKKLKIFIFRWINMGYNM
jgi:hypothetical protein